ncbi:GspH/FimT family pseudopilin [Sandarakinorhabdus sp.]|uniref:GspH/FimT family pseudopilin n=1 Tax=Sandarakinorhabdus sp. TaxID=1916663 RepID=UPI003341B3CE
MTSATGTFDARNPQAGFTLVELAVVMLIIGVASAALLLALPDPGGDVRRQADRLAAHAAAARDLAITCGCPVRLATVPAGWQVLRLAGSGWLPDPTMKAAALPAGMSLPPASIDFDATGLATPARLLISGGGNAAAVTIDAAGGVRAGAA